MRYVAFLRGINLGGRRVTGEQLCAPLRELGLKEVSSFRASGNVVFDAASPDDLESRIEATLEATLEAALGYTVEAFVRDGVEVSEVVTRQPFPAEAISASTGKPQVTFLRRAPAAGDIETALAHRSDEDRVAVVGREWYWLPSGGISQSLLDVRAIERALGRGTTRTHNTVARLHARFVLGPST